MCASSLPVGVAVTVVEDLPDLIAKGRRRVELQLGNARVVGRFVVNRSQREVSERLDDLFGNGTVASDPVALTGRRPPPRRRPTTAHRRTRRPRRSWRVRWPTTTR